MRYTAQRSSGRSLLLLIFCLCLLGVLPAEAPAEYDIQARAQARAAKGHITEVVAPKQHSVVTGKVYAETKVVAYDDNADYDVRYQIDGPSGFIYTAREAPFKLLDGEGWDTANVIPGDYTLHAFYIHNHRCIDFRIIPFTVANDSDSDSLDGEPGGDISMPVDFVVTDDPTAEEPPRTPSRGDDGPLPTAKSRNFLGMNLAEVTYYTREWVFVDAMKQSRDWLPTRAGGSTPWDSGESLTLNSEGWPILKPGQAAHTITMIDTDGAYPAGNYICTYEGDGELAFGRDARVVRREGKRITLDVTPTDSGLYLRIDRSNPSNPVRNVKLWLPGFENAESSFHPLYIERLKPFSVIRFMDWARVNGSNAVTASDLPDEDYYTQGTNDGVALKYMIELCNELGADPWFCMPHKSDDGYVFRFASQVKEQLRPDLNVYIEWSNEVWNSQFPQHDWVKARADGVSLSEDFRRVWAQESVRDFKVWRDVFGSESDRVIRVAVGQKDNPWVTEKLAEALDGQFDAISCSTYFALTSSQRGLLSSSTTASKILDLAAQEMSRGVRRNYQAHGQLARDWSNTLGRDIPLISYEGGQHYTAHGGNPPWARALINVQSHPRIYQIYLDNMREWENAGGSLFTAFNFVDKPDKWGSWGALDYQDQDLHEAHKYRALLDYKTSGNRD